MQSPGILAYLYWIILILSLFFFAPEQSFPLGRRIGWGAAVILFIIIGLKAFRVPIQ